MILKRGSQGKEVKSLQEYLGIDADGVFGPGTEKSVKEWQAAHKLSADGIVGPATWNAMGLATTDGEEHNGWVRIANWTTKDNWKKCKKN